MIKKKFNWINESKISIVEQPSKMNKSLISKRIFIIGDQIRKHKLTLLALNY